MNDSFWSQMDAVVAETLNDHEMDFEIEPPKTVKKVMNIVKRNYVSYFEILRFFFRNLRSIHLIQVLDDHDEMDFVKEGVEPPRTVKNVMNIVKRTYVSFNFISKR